MVVVWTGHLILNPETLLRACAGGGCVAWVVAGMYPKLLDRLVVLAAPHLGLFKVNR